MSRSAKPSLRRRSRVAAGAVLAACAFTGATAADATPNATDLEATVLRIGGAAITGTSIPAGRTLTPVRLTTTDPNTNDNDGFYLTAAQAPVRIRPGVTIPGSPAETATFRIDGSVVATSVPTMRLAQLQTDAGPLTVLVFTASGATYAIARDGVGTASRTVAPTSVPTAGGSLAPFQWGVLPIGARARVGSAFSQSTFNGTPSGPGGVVRATVVDADDIRRNVDTVFEEFVARGEPAASYPGLLGLRGEEVTATVTLRSGATVSLPALGFPTYGPYGFGSTAWLFDRAALAAAGATIADLTGVISQTPTDHGLTWQELGFDLA